MQFHHWLIRSTVLKGRKQKQPRGYFSRAGIYLRERKAILILKRALQLETFERVKTRATEQ